MSYSLPTFNLTCNIYSAGSYPTIRLSPKCNLAYGRRVNVQSTGGTATVGIPLVLMSLLLPKLTDVRGPTIPYDGGQIGADEVEVPAGSGRRYVVAFVDDIGKGFDNEHRIALLLQLVQPIPLT